MKKVTIIYWVFTVLFGLLMFVSAVPDLISHPEAVKVIHEDLGYPTYLLPFLGVAKMLGAITILVPGFPRLKEWAYAGLFFDLIGATYSHLAIGAPVSQWAFMVLPFGLGAMSYIFYHKRRGSMAPSR